MKTPFTNTFTSSRTRLRSMTQVFFLSASFMLFGIVAQAQTYTPVFSNVWVVTAGNYDDLPQNTGNNSRGAAISPVTTNVLFASTAANTNGGNGHVATLEFASGSNYLAQLNGTGVSGGTVTLTGVRVADDGAVYACNRADAVGSAFKIYRWADESDVATAPTVVFTGNFTWGVGAYMDVRGGGIDTEIVTVGSVTASGGAAISTNFVVFRPIDASCTTFTNFAITIPGSSATTCVCSRGVTFEGTNNVIWVRSATGAGNETRRVVYDPTTLTATCARTNAVDQTACVGLKYFSSTNGVEMLATVQYSSTLSAAQIARVFRIPTSPTAALVSVLTSNFPAPYTGSQNGNGLGNVDAKNGYVIFGAPGFGLTFFKLDFVTTAPPAVVASTSSGSVIAGYPVSFAATASGSTPLSYQWYFNTNTPIPAAITNSYSIASVQASNAGVYTLITTNLYGSATNKLTLGVIPNGSSQVATQSWALAPGSRDYLTTTDTQRGLAYDPVLQRLVLVSRAPTNGIHLLDAATGADAGVLDISELLAITPPGTYAMNMCGVADDGIVYVGNLITSGGADNYAIYSWTSADPAGSIGQAYAGNPGIGRIGDTMAVRGAGVNTEILCSFRAGTNVALFNTSDGVNFNFNLIAVTNLPVSAQANGFAGLGIAFGPGNTFFARSPSFDLRQVSYDVAGAVGGVINDYASLPVVDSAIGVDNGNAYCAGVSVAASPQTLALYDLSASGGPNVVDREFFPVNNANGNGTGAVAFDVAGGRIFALDSNNGIIALSYAGKVSIAQGNSAQVVTWPTTASLLQSAANVAGPYTTVLGATSPYTNSTGGTKFFRLSK